MHTYYIWSFSWPTFNTFLFCKRFKNAWRPPFNKERSFWNVIFVYPPKMHYEDPPYLRCSKHIYLHVKAIFWRLFLVSSKSERVPIFELKEITFHDVFIHSTFKNSNININVNLFVGSEPTIYRYDVHSGLTLGSILKKYITLYPELAWSRNIEYIFRIGSDS